MTALKSWGYPLEPVEELVIDPNADRKPTEDATAAETGEVTDLDEGTDEAVRPPVTIATMRRGSRSVPPPTGSGATPRWPDQERVGRREHAAPRVGTR
jgi:hypothetical protein